MKKIILTACIISLILSCKNGTKKKVESSQNQIAMTTLEQETTEIEKQQIHALINTLFTAVDTRAWEAVKETMADSVYTDYSALGGAMGFKTPSEILSDWKTLLPGFERTIHQVHNTAIWVADNRATATMDAIATHYLNRDQWTVFVGYDTEYIKEDNQWKLARIDVSLYDQNGNKELPIKALKNVEDGAIPKFEESNTETLETVEEFFIALEQQNLTDLLAVLDKNIVQRMPLAPSNFPKELSSIEAIRKQYTDVMDYTQSYTRKYFGTQDPNTILAKYEGTITTTDGKPYNNSYVGIYTVANGKITEFVELFNPNILLGGWPGLQPEHFSIHDAGAGTDSGVTQENVVFDNKGILLKGHLFKPPNFNSTQKYPAAVVTGSWTSVKEQMPDEYASVLAKDGFITLTFDFTGFGESEGQPRQVEDYQLKIQDIKAAIDFMVSLENVDSNNLSGLGVCASSGYMAHATAKDTRIKKLILVAPWLHNAEIAKTIYDFRPGGTKGLLQAAKEAKLKYAETGKMDYVLAASELDPLSAMYVPENIFDYYLNPSKAAGKYYDNRFAVTSWEPWLTFDGISIGQEISQPVFIVHSESGAVPQGTKQFYDLLTGEKAIRWLNDFNQQQLYFEADAVNAAMKEVINYLKG